MDTGSALASILRGPRWARAPQDDGGGNMKRPIQTSIALLFVALSSGGALAADKLKLAIGQREIWHGAPAALGQRAGIFRKHDLDLDVLFTSGGGETMQAVISGSVDIGVAIGTLGVM